MQGKVFVILERPRTGNFGIFFQGDVTVNYF